MAVMVIIWNRASLGSGGHGKTDQSGSPDQESGSLGCGGKITVRADTKVLELQEILEKNTPCPLTTTRNPNHPLHPHHICHTRFH